MMFKPGDIIRFKVDGRKYKIIDSWFDGRNNRYEIKHMVGKNLTSLSWCVTELLITKYEK